MTTHDSNVALTHYDAACFALSLARSVDEVQAIRNKTEALRAYARQAKNKQLEIDATEIRIRAERRLGELIAAQKETVGLAKGRLRRGSNLEPREDTPTLAAAGIDKKLSSRAQKLAAVPQREFEERLGEWRERIAEENERVTIDLLKSGAKHVRGTFGTGENEWYTPPEYIELARKVLGEIDLDPATSQAAQKFIRARAWFTKQTDGLKQNWCGRVWLNPPYSQPEILYFVGKLLAEWEAGRVSSAILLTHNYSDTGWFQAAAAACTALCFTRGRIKFERADGEIAMPTQGQAFFYFGPDISLFAENFESLGFVVVPYRNPRHD